MDERRCETASEFMELLRPSSKTWLSKTALYSSWGFRGQGDASWRLVPSAWRSGNDTYFAASMEYLQRELAVPRISKKVKEMVAHSVWFTGKRCSATALQRLTRVLAHYCAEQYVIDQFVDIADRVGLRIPEAEQFTDKPGLEQIICEVEQGKGVYPHPAVAIAQHHGVPTQLLDFTRRGVVAAFFAADSAQRALERSKRAAKRAPKNLAVWAANCEYLSESGTLTKCEYSRTISQYLLAQDGFFLFHPKAYVPFVKKGRWPPFDAIINEAGRCSPEPILYKLLLPVNQSQELLRLLWAEGYYLATVMPSYDNVGNSLRTLLNFFALRKEGK